HNARTANPAEQRSIGSVIVSVLSINNLLGALTFLLAYFAMLWLVLRWDTQRRVTRQFARWYRLEDPADPALNLDGQALNWLGGLLEPIRVAREQMDALARR